MTTIEASAAAKASPTSGIEFHSTGLTSLNMVLTGFSESVENQQSVATVIGAGITLEQWI